MNYNDYKEIIEKLKTKNDSSVTVLFSFDKAQPFSVEHVKIKEISSCYFKHNKTKGVDASFVNMKNNHFSIEFSNAFTKPSLIKKAIQKAQIVLSKVSFNGHDLI